MTDAQLIGEAYNVLCHESTASALTWAVFLLSQHPEIAASRRRNSMGHCAETHLPLLS
jgi:cytochrome P450